MFGSGDRELPTAKTWQIQVDQQFLRKSDKIFGLRLLSLFANGNIYLVFPNKGQVGMDEHLYGKKIKLLK